MAYQQQMDLFRRVLAGAAGRPDLTAVPQTCVPVWHYTDADVFAREQACLFRRFPLCLTHESILAEPGCVRTHDATGLPIVLTRDRAGVLHAFLNVCRHRGTRLISEEGVCKRTRLVCPYHGWAYGLDGALKTVPLEDDGFPGLDKHAFGLARLPLEVRDGLVWVLPDPAGRLDLDGHLAGLDGDFASFGLADHGVFAERATPVEANWKLITSSACTGTRWPASSWTPVPPPTGSAGTCARRWGGQASGRWSTSPKACGTCARTSPSATRCSPTWC